MIKIINKAFQVGQQAYVSLEEAQKAELKSLASNVFLDGNKEAFADLVISNKAKILDVLTTTVKSRPNRRKINQQPSQVQV